jgi:hypothetical protein
MGWQLNPDRMGGSFSQDEIDNTGWKWTTTNFVQTGVAS